MSQRPATLSPRSRIGIARQAKAEPPARTDDMAAAYLGRFTDSPYPQDAALAPPHGILVPWHSPSRKRIASLEYVRQRTQTTQQSLDARPGEARYWAIAKHGGDRHALAPSVISVVRNQTDTAPSQAIIRRGLWTRSAQNKAGHQRTHGPRANQTRPKGGRDSTRQLSTQAIGISIQIGTHGAVQPRSRKPDHARRTRAIGPAKPIPLEPFTRIIQVFPAPSMIQQSLTSASEKPKQRSHQVESGVVRQYEQPCKESAASAGPGHSIRHVSRNESRAQRQWRRTARDRIAPAGSAPEAPSRLHGPTMPHQYPSTSNTTCSSQAISSSSMSTPSTEATSSSLACATRNAFDVTHLVSS